MPTIYTSNTGTSGTISGGRNHGSPKCLEDKTQMKNKEMSRVGDNKMENKSEMFRGTGKLLRYLSSFQPER